jgi:hypothetical protein
MRSGQTKQGKRQKPPSIIRAASATKRRVWRCSFEARQSLRGCEPDRGTRTEWHGK